MTSAGGQRAVEAADGLAAGVDARGRGRGPRRRASGARTSGAAGCGRSASPGRRSLPRSSRTTAHHSGRSVGGGSPASRRSRYRLVTVAITVVTTGSAASWASATARNVGGIGRELDTSYVMRSNGIDATCDRDHPNILGGMTSTPEQARSTTSAEQRSVVVPDKPALEGLEAKWSERWKADADLQVRPHPLARRGLLDRHPAADGVREPARRARLLLHAHRPDRPLPADARQGRVLPDGLGRQRPADRAPGAELLRRALRPVAAVRPVVHAAGEAGPEAPGAGRPAQLRRALRAAGGRGREGLRGPVAHSSGCRSTGDEHYTTIGPKSQQDQPGGVPAQLRPRRGLPRRRADAVGRDVPDGRGAGRAGGP